MDSAFPSCFAVALSGKKRPMQSSPYLENPLGERLSFSLRSVISFAEGDSKTGAVTAEYIDEMYTKVISVLNLCLLKYFPRLMMNDGTGTALYQAFQFVFNIRDDLCDVCWPGPSQGKCTHLDWIGSCRGRHRRPCVHSQETTPDGFAAGPPSDLNMYDLVRTKTKTVISH